MPVRVAPRAGSGFNQTMSAAIHPAEPSRPRSRRDWVAGCALAAIVLLLGLPLLYLVLNFTVQTVHVIGSAMEPTFRTGDYLVADKLAYRLRAPERGDVVIVRDPSDPTRDLIKRVLGLPGERVLVSGCTAFVNGRRLAEPYMRVWSDCNPSWPAGGQPQMLASDEFFMMGDNRDHSTDSRQLGPIRRDQIEAQVRVRLFPVGRR